MNIQNRLLRGKNRISRHDLKLINVVDRVLKINMQYS